MPATPNERALAEKIEQAALESGVTYGGFINVLEFLIAVYRYKGSNLLSETSLRTIAETPQFCAEIKTPNNKPV